MIPLGTILSSGWAAGLNLYAVIAVLGIAGRAGWAETPDELQHGWVIALAVAMYAAEFVIDKIPYVDNAWDALHTFVRPAGAVAIGALGSGSPRDAAIAGVLALAGHGAKATTRVAANASPEPFSNIALSLTEDGIVFAILTLALTRPRLAGALALVAAALCVVAVVVLWRFARRIFSFWRSRVSA